jgi:C-terminal processing protease CtpA/Prc
MLQNDLASVAHDLHMRVRFSPERLPPQPPLPSLARLAAQEPPREDSNFAKRWIDRIGRSMATFGVEKVDHLSPKIGYLKISGFPPPHLTAEKYAAAMDKLADTDALIIDVRDNGGGTPTSVALLVSYFVDQRTHLNDIWERASGETVQFWTEDKLDGKRYGGKKPVVILAGPGTASAGEDFTYTMQALKRATVVGERTWGGAHPTMPWRLGDHFYAAIPSARSISPITHTNWEGTGVIPDVAAPPAEALAVAKELLRRRYGATVAQVAAE